MVGYSWKIALVDVSVYECNVECCKQRWNIQRKALELYIQ